MAVLHVFYYIYSCGELTQYLKQARTWIEKVVAEIGNLEAMCEHLRVLYTQNCSQWTSQHYRHSHRFSRLAGIHDFWVLQPNCCHQLSSIANFSTSVLYSLLQVYLHTTLGILLVLLYLSSIPSVVCTWMCPEEEQH